MSTQEQLQQQLANALAQISNLEAAAAAAALAPGPSNSSDALTAANAQIEELQAQLLTQSVAGQELEKVFTNRTPKVSTPDTFDGSRDKLQTYLTQIGTYLLFNQKLFPTQEEKVLYAASYLRGPAASWFQPYALEFLARRVLST